MAENEASSDTVQMLDFLRSQKTAPPLQSTNATIAVPVQVQEPIGPPLAPPTNPVANTTLQGQLLPLANRAVAQLSSGLNAPPSAVTAQGNVSWFDRNQRKDALGRPIPIDTNTGLDLKEYSRMVWQRRPEERILVLKKMFPNSIVRQADTGEPIVEVAGPEGRNFDVLVNPTGLDPKDFIEVGAGAAPPTVGGIVGGVVGEGLGTVIGGATLGKAGASFGGRAGRILGAAAGTGIGGGAQDVAARTLEDVPLNMKEIAATQAKNAALNAMFDAGIWAGAKSLRLASPFATDKGPLQFDLEKGKQYFKDVHDVDFRTTPAEESGSRLLGRVEATEAPQPGASTVIGDLYKEGQEQIAKIYDVALGKRVPDDQLGSDLIHSAQRRIVEPAEEAVVLARQKLQRAGENELVNIIDGIAPVGKTSRLQAGESVREEFKAAHAAAKKAKDDAYAAVKALPGGKSKILPGDPVADAADAILEELPKVLKTEVVPSVDAYGNPISKAVVREKVLSSGRPEGLAAFLSDMRSQRGQKMTIDELTTLKNAARDEIAKTEAVPGVKDRWFGLITDAYDRATLSGLDALPTGDLKDALLKARNIYKTKFVPFDREGLHDVLRTPYEAGFQAPEQLVNRLFSGVRADHNYRVLQEALGKNSPAFSKVRRAVLDQWKLDATDPLTQRINPAKFEESVLGLRSSHPAIYEDVIGPAEKQFFEATAALRAARKEIRDVDPDELSALLRSGKVTKEGVEKLMDAQRRRDSVLSNVYLKDLAAGKTPKQSPSQFVSSLFNSEIDNGYLTEVLGAQTPSNIENLQTAALYRIATKASESKIDLSKWLHGTQSPVQAHALAKAIGPVGSLERQRNEILLGPDLEALVKNTIAVLGPREEKTGLFGAAGGMAATGLIEKLLRVPLQYASAFVRKSIIASLYTSSWGKNILINRIEGPAETAAFANMLIAYEPFVRKLRDVFNQDAAYTIVRDAKSSIDRFVAQDARPTEPETQKKELFQFLEGNKSSVKIQAVPAR